MDEIELLIDLHRGTRRQGPGSVECTRQAMGLAGLDPETGLHIADLGCGTGASALQLAEELGAQVTAIDFSAAFLKILADRARSARLTDRIHTVQGSIDDLPFEHDSLDAIWSEGAIYNIGFENGLSSWRPYLKPGGVLAVSEITWTGANRPAEIESFWKEAYPEIATASEKMVQIENTGYSPVGYFLLPPNCWLDEYYRPLEKNFERFLERHESTALARTVVEETQKEIQLFLEFGAYYSYGFYVAKRTD